MVKMANLVGNVVDAVMLVPFIIEPQVTCRVVAIGGLYLIITGKAVYNLL